MAELAKAVPGLPESCRRLKGNLGSACFKPRWAGNLYLLGSDTLEIRCARGALKAGEISHAASRDGRIVIPVVAPKTVRPLVRQAESATHHVVVRMTDRASARFQPAGDAGRLGSIKLADRHPIIERGRVVWQGDSSTLRQDERVQGAYPGV